MKLLKRFVYLTYYLKQGELKKVTLFLDYASVKSGYSKRRLMFDAVRSVFKYNTSIKDYFYFRFFELSSEERKKWAGTGFMYEYQLIMNPKGKREVLENKIMFLNSFNTFVKRNFLSLEEIRNDTSALNKMLNSNSRLVIKNSRGQVGAEVKVISTNDYNSEQLSRIMEKEGFDLVEEYVEQHPDLMALSPSGLNTVRIFTQLNRDNVEILGARLRISVNSPVDNMGAGNLAAPIDVKSGIVYGPGVYSDITKEDQTIHPVTGKSIKGFEVPFWKETVDMAKKAALHVPENRSVGWDIAITSTGPELIEGNHNWCKLLWQLPVKEGLKNELIKYM